MTLTVVTKAFITQLYSDVKKKIAQNQTALGGWSTTVLLCKPLEYYVETTEKLKHKMENMRIENLV